MGHSATAITFSDDALYGRENESQTCQSPGARIRQISPEYGSQMTLYIYISGMYFIVRFGLSPRHFSHWV
jgi:hypothetical protein